nr:bifunctional metallophosphatase/5'-nucleotidase [uncultured Bacteroides sp.]
MKRLIVCFLLTIFFLGTIFAQSREVVIKLLHTSDVHGNLTPYDFINDKMRGGSLARVSTYVNEQRQKFPGHVLLFDGGDFLQGQPSVYYYNYIDTISPHIASEVLNYMKYDALTLGNHDVETGHPIYDRWIKQCNAPVLSANTLRKDGSSYLQPYKTFIVDGVKIAVLGLITPSIPAWVNEDMWSGLWFEDMEVSAKKWMKIIREKENPDIVVGLFHSGIEPYKLNGLYNENASLEVAKNVPGFDVVFAGHDHIRFKKKIVNIAGDSVLVMDPASRAGRVSDVLLTVKIENGKVVSKRSSGKLGRLTACAPDEAFMSNFAPQFGAVKSFVSRPIGKFDKTISSRDALFKSSEFLGIIHSVQLGVTQADISFTAPLTGATSIYKGEVYMRDLFKLYAYENMICTMELTGKEVKDYMEESYAMWTNQMKSADDHLLLLKQDDGGKYDLVNYSYNFDTAAGVVYTVDVTKPAGEKIRILRMSNDKPFNLNKKYKVAINSYRANGGGELLTKGAGIPLDSLKNRILVTFPKDLRFYLMKYIESKGVVSPKPMNRWKFIPAKWVKAAAKRDRELLFNKED